jgi:hypothetical protein
MTTNAAALLSKVTALIRRSRGRAHLDFGIEQLDQRSQGEIEIVTTRNRTPPAHRPDHPCTHLDSGPAAPVLAPVERTPRRMAAINASASAAVAFSL